MFQHGPVPEKRKLPLYVYANIFLVLFALILFFLPEIKFVLLKNRSFDQGKKPISDFEQKEAVSIQKSFRKVFEFARDGVVSIRTTQNGNFSYPYMQFDRKNEPVAALGSGIILNRRGYIVTNYHVIDKADTIDIILSNGKVEKGKLIGSHERADLALIKINESPELKPAKFGDSDEVDVGDWAIAMGSPFGLEKTFTVGVVSAKSREDLDETGQTHIQTDAAINPGSSGGPLLNINGSVIGINRMIRSSSGSSAGIGFAIPINYAKKVINLIENNPGVIIRPATLGVFATIPLPEHRNALGIDRGREGILVYNVEPFSSAFFGSVQKYDYITEANDSRIRNINDLREQVGLTGLGGRLKLKILRNGKEMILYVKLISQKNR
ncbi:MAG: trypsin-like peptidase domain-containing protein [Leptospira sp.]|nr:trypsin-like peptidase domain-containing protein [Leptospira sp.]